MSADYGKFEPLNECDEEVAHLYRLRDNDPSMQNEKPLFNNLNNSHRDSQISFNPVVTLFMWPNDPYWDSLTEKERIEHGVVSKYFLRMNSPAGLIFLMYLGSKLKLSSV